MGVLNGLMHSCEFFLPISDGRPARVTVTPFSSPDGAQTHRFHKPKLLMPTHVHGILTLSVRGYYDVQTGKTKGRREVIAGRSIPTRGCAW